jgi:hypothetical protein
MKHRMDGWHAPSLIGSKRSRCEAFAPTLNGENQGEGAILAGEGIAASNSIMSQLKQALPQKSISVVTSFVFNSCDFVDRFFCPEN